MTQASLLSECRAAYTLGKAKVREVQADNILLDIIKTFGGDKRVLVFPNDAHLALQELEGTLMDADHITAAIQEFDALISGFGKIREAMTERRTEIITRKAEAGITHEGPFEIYPVISKTNRAPDIEKIKKEAPKKWDMLLDLKIEEVKETYKPNQTALKTVFGKGFEKYLITGSETITGYDIRLIDQMPEKGSVEVEP